MTPAVLHIHPFLWLQIWTSKNDDGKEEDKNILSDCEN